MKKLSFLSLAAFLPFYVQAQQPTATENYIHKKVYKTPVTPANVSTVPASGKLEQVTYLDDQGRPKQQIVIGGGGTGKEIVQYYTYDNMGRPSRQYLPITATNANPYGYDATVNETTINTYYRGNFAADFPSNQGYAYSETEFSKSPDARPLKRSAPGNSWKREESGDDHTMKSAIATNITDDVMSFDVDYTGTNYMEPAYTFNGFYPAGSLFVSIIKNENWKSTDGKINTIESYTDLEGKTVLTRTFSWNATKTQVLTHNHYFLYDDFGNLIFSMPPKLTETFQVSGSAYEHLNQSISYSELIDDPSFPPSINVAEVSRDDNSVVVDFDFELERAGRMRTGHIKLISTSLPDMFVGYLTNGTFKYAVSIHEGYLNIENVAGVEMPELYVVNQTFTVNLPMLNPTLAAIPLAAIDGLAYKYHYDERNRLAEKKVPGKGWEYTVYNGINVPVLTQNPTLAADGLWSFVTRDRFGRTAYSGTYANSNNRANVQITANANAIYFETQTTTYFAGGATGTQVFYTRSGFPAAAWGSLANFSVTCYDNYNFTPSNMPTAPTSVYDEVLATNVKGLPTLTIQNILGTVRHLISVITYNTRGELVATASNNTYFRSGTTNTSITNEVVRMDRDFTGKVIESRTDHTRPGLSSISTFDFFTYDHMGRLLEHKHRIGTSGTTQLLAYNKYDELGRLTEKKVGGTPAASYALTSGLQTVNYNYNVRGWLKSINNPTAPVADDLFNMELRHDNASDPALSQFNGNISQQLWLTQGTDTSLKQYSYKYDALNRLTEAVYQSTLNGTTTVGAFNEAMTYDSGGNVLTMKRAGSRNDFSIASNLDDLTYTYTYNRLDKVEDAGIADEGYADLPNVADFTYNATTGAMQTDANKGIVAIQYNFMGQPTLVDFGNKGKIEYVYLASGARMAKKITQGSVTKTTNYVGNFIYEVSTNTPEALKFFAHSDGYVGVNGSNYQYVYQIADQLGNIRVSFAKSGSNPVAIVEENSYYPYGSKHRFSSAVSPLGDATAQKYDFNGREYEEVNAFNIMEMDFRQYDPSLGRFQSIDALAEAEMGLTPYHFAGGNPVMFGDPTGLVRQIIKAGQINEYWVTHHATLSYDAYSQLDWRENHWTKGMNFGPGSEGYLGGSGGGMPGWAADIFKSVFGNSFVQKGNSYYLKYNDGYIMANGDFLLIPKKILIGIGEGNSNFQTENRSNVVEPNFNNTLSVLGNIMTVTDFIRESPIGNFVRSGRVPSAGITNTLKWGGRALGVLGILMTGVQYANKDISGAEATVDGIMGVVGFFGPVGAGISLTYFIGKGIYEYASGETLFEKPKKD